jgi:hypothetical protein
MLLADIFFASTVYTYLCWYFSIEEISPSNTKVRSTVRLDISRGPRLVHLLRAQEFGLLSFILVSGSVQLKTNLICGSHYLLVRKQLLFNKDKKFKL